MTDLERYELCKFAPDWVLKNNPEWFLEWPHTTYGVCSEYLLEHIPDWVITNRPLDAIKKDPEFVADNYPHTMIFYNIAWMVENRPGYMMKYHKEKMLDYLSRQL